MKRESSKSVTPAAVDNEANVCLSEYGTRFATPAQAWVLVPLPPRAQGSPALWLLGQLRMRNITCWSLREEPIDDQAVHSAYQPTQAHPYANSSAGTRLPHRRQQAAPHITLLSV